VAARSGLQESALSAPEGAAHGCDQDRIRCFQEGRIKWGRSRIPAQNHNPVPRSHRQIPQGQIPLQCSYALCNTRTALTEMPRQSGWEHQLECHAAQNLSSRTDLVTSSATENC